jgi:RHS repeat-associated protein
VTDTYDYDAFGNLVNSTGSTPNNYLFAGEQFDPALSLYYNRARYLNATTGRFWTLDLFEGNYQDPPSLHKYLYAGGDPVDSSDPTGRTPSNFIYGNKVHTYIGADFTSQAPNRYSNVSINTVLGASVPGGSLRPDLVDKNTEEVYEIKPLDSAALGYPQLAGYLIILNRYDPLKRVWVPGSSYLPPDVVPLDGLTVAFVSAPAGGVIIYQVFNGVEITALVAVAAAVALPETALSFATATLEAAF